MEFSRFKHTVEYLLCAIAVALLPEEATAQANAPAIQAPIFAMPYRLIDYLTLELILLGALVLLALVVIGRRSRAR